MMIYEYHNNTLGVQARCLYRGKNKANDSIEVLSDRGIQHRIKSGYLNRLRPNAPGHPMLISWLTLPPDWQRKLIERFGEPAKQVKQSWFEQHFIHDTEALHYFTSYRLENDRVLPDTVIDEYSLNASVLNTVKKVYNNRYAYRKAMRGAVQDIWSIVSNECNRFKDIHAHTLPTNAAALRRKLKQYQKEGYNSLIHGSWCNTSALKVDEHTIGLLNAMFTSQNDKPTATEIHRQYEGFLAGHVEVINNQTGEVYNPSEFKKLSNSTVKSYLAKWVNKAATYAKRSGNRQVLMSQFKPYHSLKHPEYAGSIISIDDRQPPFEYAKGKRVWFYNGIDLGSEAITTWVYGQSKDGIIRDFYRQMVRNYYNWGFNLPAELEAESSLNSSFKKTFLKPGNMFQEVRIEANNARGKRIEAYFRPLRYELEKKREGWIARPFAKSEANQAGSQPVQIIPYEHIIKGCLNDIQIWNNMEHSKYKGKSRWDVFCEKQHADLKPINWRGILPYLGKRTLSTCNVGQIKLNNELFILGEDGKRASHDRLIPLLDLIEGKEIDIYWLDDNNGKVIKALIYINTDQYICEAVAKPTYSRAKIEQTDKDAEARTEMSKYVAIVDGFIRKQKNAIDKVTVIDNRPRTLNNNFQIPELNKGVTEAPNYEEPEILDDPLNDEDDFNGFANGFQKDLKDRF